MTSLLEVIKRLCPDLSVYSYADNGDFNQLWSALDGTAQPLASQVAVIWDSTWVDPSVAPVDTGRQVSPLDWAACAAAAWPGMQTCVIDLDPAAHSNDPAVELHESLSIGRGLDWVRVMRPADLTAFTSGDELRQIMFPDARTNGAPALLEAFFLMRRHALTDPDPSGDRHAITNIIGPLVLLGRTPGELQGHTKALWHLLRKSGLVKGEPGDRGPEPPPLTALEPLSPVRVVLLDDQWHQGWAEWVCQRLGLPWDDGRVQEVRPLAQHAPQWLAGNRESGVSLWVAGGPEWLRERLQAVLTDGHLDARFRLRLVDTGEEASEVLLLDLRLFQAGSPAERSFMASIEQLARRFVSDGAWPVFTERELDSVKKWALSATDEDVDRSAALTLLPRLVAQVDLSLPIVLFSSTGRREIVGRLRGYESVNTRFAKPRFFGDPTNVSDDAANAFYEAMREAAELVHGRRGVVSCVPNARDDDDAHDRLRSHRGGDDAATLQYVEAYFDESGGGSWMKVGGILARYRSQDAAVEFSEKLRDAGHVWGHDCDLPRAANPPARRKKASEVSDSHIASKCLEIDQLATDHGVELSAFLVRGTRSAEKQDLLKPGSPDHIYRLLVRRAVECILFAWPASRTANAEVSLHVATRVRYSKQQSVYDDLLKRWGVDSGAWGAYVFSFDDVYPMVTDILGTRAEEGQLPNVVMAKGVGLRYYPEPARLDPPKLPRQIHYLADWAASCPHSLPEGWWQRGFRDLADGSFDALLRAARSADRTTGQVDAIEQWRLASNGISSHALPLSAGRWFRQRLAEATERLTGGQFKTLCSRFAAGPALPRQVMVTGIPKAVTEQEVSAELRRILERDGRQVEGIKVRDAHNPRDRNRPEFIAYVTFRTHDEARAAILTDDGKALLKRNLSIGLAQG